MPRVFNTAGPCLADEHYMISATRRVEQVRDLIDGKHDFIIHAPRQTGKTTLLRNLSRELTEEGRYAALTVSLESFTDPDVPQIMPQILVKLQHSALQQLPGHLGPPSPDAFAQTPHIALNAYLSAWSASIDRALVVFFDEIDAIPGPLLISVLRQLRDGYTSRPAPFPQSVALVGLRDVRDFKVRVRPDSESLGTASPFNIKTRSLSLRNFTPEEVAELLGQHTHETGQAFEPEAVKEIFHQTQGQPWLVNALASQLTTSYDALVPDRTVAVPRDKVLEAREILIERRDTHLDSLVARRLQRGVADLFPTPHLRYRREPGLACDGTTLVEIVEHSRMCRELLNRALGMGLPQRLKDRIAEDERAFTYGEQSVAYFYACVQAFQEARAGRSDAARQHYAEAVRLAELLREDQTSAALSSSHANATDAFAASYAAQALDHLAKLLGTPPPSTAKGEPN